MSTTVYLALVFRGLSKHSKFKKIMPFVLCVKAPQFSHAPNLNLLFPLYYSPL